MLGAGILTAALAGTLSSVRVTVDRNGLAVASRLILIPLRRIPRQKIRSVKTVNFQPLEWGGWGYRVLPGRSAILLRRGPGILVTLVNGRVFGVTVDDPQEAVDLLTSSIT